MNEIKKATGFRRIVNAGGYSLAGLITAWRGEAAFRQEALLLAVMLPCAFFLGRSAVERGLLIATCLVVLIAELLNSAIEAVVDRIGLERHPLAGAAKDLGSAAVFIALALVMLVWGLVAYERWC